MKNIKLSTKLIGSYIVIALIGALIGYIGISSIRSLNAELRNMYEINTKPTSDAAEYGFAFRGIRNTIRDLIIDRFILNQDVQVYVERIHELDKKTQELIPLIEKSLQTEEGKRLFAQLQSANTRFDPIRERLIALAKEGKATETMALMRGEALQLAKSIDEAIAQIFSLKVSMAKTSAEDSQAQANTAMTLAMSITLAGFLFALGLGIFLTRSITRPIHRIIDGLTEGAVQVTSASGQLSASSQSLAEGASEQAASIEETSASMEEMSSMTRQNAEHAGQANTLMKDTRGVMDQANQAMAELTESMRDISASSEETAKIIRTIDEIAFQTNLLALNAAVEAARAGEAGAGFAVVADEVRNLAMRAAEAAKNTASLIEGSLKKTKNGSMIVDRTNEAFAKVAAGAGKAAELVAEIAVASQEQTQGIDQVNKAVAEMDKVVQLNAASAEESASASEEMNAQAEQMKVNVGELAALIGGSTNGKSGHPRHLPRRIGQSAGKISHHALSEPTGQAGGQAKKPPRTMERRPEQIIPLADKDFEDF
jgi:methyl-accepting chemotaxis protein